MSEKKITLTKKEAKALLFWASVGAFRSNAGTWERELLKVFPRIAKEAGMQRGDFGYLPPLNNRLGKRLIFALSEIFSKTDA